MPNRQSIPPSPYPAGWLGGIINSDYVTPITRGALHARSEWNALDQQRFLENDAFRTLRAVCDRLVPQDDLETYIDIAGQIDRRLACGDGDGWRFAVLPPDPEAMQQGLAGIDALSRMRFALAFAALADDQQDLILEQVQAGNPPGASWQDLSASRFFEDLLAEAVEVFYAHPLAQQDIGYAGMADAHGWGEVGLDHLAPPEPRIDVSEHE